MVCKIFVLRDMSSFFLKEFRISQTSSLCDGHGWDMILSHGQGEVLLSCLWCQQGLRPQCNTKFCPQRVQRRFPGTSEE